MTDQPINPTVENEPEEIETAETVETVETPSENEEAEPVTAETSEDFEFTTSYVIEVPSANEVSMVYFVVLGAVLLTYAVANLIVGIVRK